MTILGLRRSPLRKWIVILLGLLVCHDALAEDKPIPELDQPIQQYEKNIKKLSINLRKKRRLMFSFRIGFWS